MTKQSHTSRRRLIGIALTLMLAVSAVIPVATSASSGLGCTPGYWKNHTGLGPQANAWVGASWSDLFEATDAPPGIYFNDAFGNMTLLEVLSQGGGGLSALGRHTVAAYLNARAFNYDLSASAVVRRFNWATDGDPSTGLSLEAQKNEFAALNEQYCPLN